MLQFAKRNGALIPFAVNRLLCDHGLRRHGSRTGPGDPGGQPRDVEAVRFLELSRIAVRGRQEGGAQCGVADVTAVELAPLRGQAVPPDRVVERDACPARVAPPVTAAPLL
jgi:hypothetical protein